MPRKDHPPISLEHFKNSVLHRKLEFVLALLRWAINWLNEVQEMTPRAAFDGLATAKRIRRTAYAIEKTFEEAALAEMFHAGQTAYRGTDYFATMHTGERKNWKNAKVMEQLIEQTVERMHEQRPYVPKELLHTLVKESMWEIHKNGRIQWRSTSLRKSGLNPDALSDKSSDRATIELVGAGSYPTASPIRPRGVQR